MPKAFREGGFSSVRDVRTHPLPRSAHASRGEFRPPLKGEVKRPATRQGGAAHPRRDLRENHEVDPSSGWD